MTKISLNRELIREVRNILEEEDLRNEAGRVSAAAAARDLYAKQAEGLMEAVRSVLGDEDIKRIVEMSGQEFAIRFQDRRQSEYGVREGLAGRTAYLKIFEGNLVLTIGECRASLDDFSTTWSERVHELIEKYGLIGEDLLRGIYVRLADVVHAKRREMPYKG